MKVLVWIFQILIFFILFIFAIQNQHPAVIKWPFGYQWESKTIFIILAAFAFGCAVGILAMLPGWWRHRGLKKIMNPKNDSPTATPSAAAQTTPPPDGF